MIGNAIEFTKAFHVLLMVRQTDDKLGAHDAVQFRISIEDIGVGTPEEKSDRVFEWFYQAESSTTHSHSGTGMGPAICKHLIGQMQGRITIDGEVNRGSTFICTFLLRSDSDRPA